MQRVRCTLTPGLFTGEYAATVVEHNGKSVLLFVPESSVLVESSSKGAENQQGWLEVEVLERRDELNLVLLPQPAVEDGRTITVTSGELLEE